MDFLVKSGSADKQRASCLIVGLFETRRLSSAGEKIDNACAGSLSAILRRGDIEGKLGQSLMLHNLGDSLSERILLVGCGKEREFGELQYRKAVTSALQALRDTHATDAIFYLSELSVKDRGVDWLIQQAIQLHGDIHYRADQLKSKPEKEKQHLRKLTFNVLKHGDVVKGELAVTHAQAISSGVKLAKDLGNLPGNICTPKYLSKQARALGKDNPKLKVTVMGREGIEKQKMGALLAVAQGSVQEPQFIVMEYQGAAKSAAPIVLVGKGITFDSGGISLKPGAAMDEMKYDMCGAASVLGTMKACMQLKLPINLVGIIPSAENKPDAGAINPGDIVTSMSGASIEILNTDAEGRLILCDALTYAERFKPAKVIDIATLTGACIVALGHHMSGVMGNHNPLIQEILNAGNAVYDLAWGLPMSDEYQEQLQSNFADIPNIAGRDAGSITAACFLSRFTKKYHWAHMDIAGTAWKSGAEKGATGRPVPLLTQFLISNCK